ncbi:DUF6531 domain-containing protein [Pseudomonas sp. dw_358]|uniref:DUF6531 domain-containing protein n=1 Tax=Pseudomonas sp. dw_358 TaxID=2720083 RepID=UPI001BD2AD97|nr:DUF6531 domain-containing protein [Pseudomonas sp. dw_358]
MFEGRVHFLETTVSRVLFVSLDRCISLLFCKIFMWVGGANKLWRRKISVATVLVCLLFSGLASAETYSFWAGDGYPGRSISAPAACSYLLSDYAVYTIAPYHTPASDYYKSNQDNIPDSDMYWCTAAFNFPWNPGSNEPSQEVFNVVKTTWTCPDGDSMDLSVGLCGTFAQAGLPDKPYACPVLNSPLPSSSIGNPINLATGNKYQEEEAFTLGAASIIKVSQFYNSFYGAWTHSYSDRLYISDDSAFLVLSDNSQTIFSAGSNGYTSKTDAGTLVGNDSGWLYSSPDGISRQFNADGRLISIQYPDGRMIHVSYSGTVLTIDDGVAQATITEDYNFQMIKATTGNITVAYQFVNNGLNRYTNLQSATKTIDDKFTTRTYVYDSTQYGKLTGIVDERGIQYATWGYDPNGRANMSQHAGEAGKVTLTYNPDGSTTVVNALGKTSIYKFQVVNGVNHIVAIQGQPSPNCPESDSSYAYNDRGQVVSKTDAKGSVTTFTYNDRGLEISRTEAAGTPLARTTTSEWDASRFLPIRVVTPTQSTSYTYDAQGRTLSQQVSAH